jgi:electron transfer flavoprotein alpha subunit
MANAFAFAETRGGTARKVAYEAVTAARTAAEASGGGEVHALLVGGPDIGAVAEQLARHGADVIHVLAHEGLARGNAEVASAAAAEVLRRGGFAAGFFSASAEGRDLAPRVAGLLDLPLASDITSFELSGDSVIAKHPTYIGKAIATLRLPAAPALLSLRPGAIAVVERPGAGRVEPLTPPLDPSAARVRVTELSARAAAKLDLGEAPVVVSGGRGLKAAENFRLVEELAAAFGNAAVGATRAVTDDGWRPSADQIGQTGRMVSPALYVAVGISGAIQHLAGMRTAKVIVAINRDKDAPIFKVADYGIVGDLFEVLPRLTEEIRKARREH